MRVLNFVNEEDAIEFFKGHREVTYDNTDDDGNLIDYWWENVNTYGHEEKRNATKSIGSKSVKCWAVYCESNGGRLYKSKTGVMFGSKLAELYTYPQAKGLCAILCRRGQRNWYVCKLGK